MLEGIEVARRSVCRLASLQCNEYNAFHIGEACHSLSNHMNGHRFTTTVLNPDPPVAIHIPSSPDSLNKIADLLASYTNYLIPPLTTFAVNLKLYTNLFSIQVILRSLTCYPHLFHPCTQWRLQFHVSLNCSYCRRRTHCVQQLHLFLGTLKSGK